MGDAAAAANRRDRVTVTQTRRHLDRSVTAENRLPVRIPAGARLHP